MVYFVGSQPGLRCHFQNVNGSELGGGRRHLFKKIIGFRRGDIKIKCSQALRVTLQWPSLPEITAGGIDQNEATEKDYANDDKYARSLRTDPAATVLDLGNLHPGIIFFDRPAMGPDVPLPYPALVCALWIQRQELIPPYRAPATGFGSRASVSFSSAVRRFSRFRFCSFNLASSASFAFTRR